ncbi:phosphoglucomutase [Dongia mobilis]|uniref:phosphoglucomutase (alpha-D-glucose-1,6-bisphosphate-dependent) n=1 Tax=Dongia mobilis TaxID=578943 RepID=A0A4R6WQB5_9PROT|nr:alpha-D-glucose phosphate-specific phosphoglucomutase [Dongia mobilis]TDQ83325.1 phosphoglucomutase [Dongia mobilis]
MTDAIQRIACHAFRDQRPGTSGLRKRVLQFQTPHYLAMFVQAIFEGVGDLRGAAIALGGDGRFFNREASEIILRMAAAHGVARVVVGRGGLMSTPAVSNLIRQRGLKGGIILSASHNPGGPDGDFGIKYNVANGGPAPESVTEAIFRHSQSLAGYDILGEAAGKVDLDRTGEQRLGQLVVEVVDCVADYARLMEQLFDFERMRRWLKSNRLVFDAMHAVTGPYAEEILVKRLGAPASALLNAVPKPDFGNHHPDPNPAHAEELMARMWAADAPALGAASDGDGDRNMIVGPRMAVSPSDSLAVMLANAALIPGYSKGVSGVARSMPTSRAADVVARELGLEAFETPTGWKFFGNLLDAGRVTLCGEESYGTGSDHVREKDGLWAVLFWLNLVAVSGRSVPDLLGDHWRRFGRHYYSRHDYEAVDSDLADDIVARLRGRLGDLSGRSHDGRRIELTDDFRYVDPVDHSVSERQGLRLVFADGSRIILRLSGTGTVGATLRLYLEQFEPRTGRLDREPAEALGTLAELAEEIVGIRRISGRTRPDVVT